MKVKKAFNKLAIILSSVVIMDFVLFINSYKESRDEVNSFSETVSYNDLIYFIGHDLQENGYRKISLDYTILPAKNVEIIIKLADKYIDENIKKEVQQIAIDSITTHNFDPQFFRIIITNNITM